MCDIAGNEYFLVEAFLDHRKIASALSVGDKKAFIKGKGTLRK